MTDTDQLVPEVSPGEEWTGLKGAQRSFFRPVRVCIMTTAVAASANPVGKESVACVGERLTRKHEFLVSPNTLGGRSPTGQHDQGPSGRGLEPAPQPLNRHVFSWLLAPGPEET